MSSTPSPGRQIERNGDIEVTGERVALRPFGGDDRASVEPWHGDAAGAGPGGGRLAVTLPGDDAPIGLVDFRIGHPEEGWLAIDFVGVAPQLRGHGYGSEAVRLLEEEMLRRALARHFEARVKLDDGLCIYFWLRLGYRPQPGDDIIAMVRTV